MSRALASFVCVVLAAGAAACGGVTDVGNGTSANSPEDEREVDGGSGSGARGHGGRSGGGGDLPAGGNRPAAGGAWLCCEALPECHAGDRALGEGERCPSGARCYETTLCCSTARCVARAECGAVAVCDSGDRQVPACPPARSCYSRSVCGATITCVEPLGCDPGAEPHRAYVGASPEECAHIDLGCPLFTAFFENACGCGCEQDPSCPARVTCGDAATDPPACTPEGHVKCPYTERRFLAR